MQHVKRGSPDMNGRTETPPEVELGRCRYFRSVSVSGIFSVFFKVDIGILKYRDISFGIGIFSRPLLLLL